MLISSLSFTAVFCPQGSDVFVVEEDVDEAADVSLFVAYAFSKAGIRFFQACEYLGDVPPSAATTSSSRVSLRRGVGIRTDVDMFYCFVMVREGWRGPISPATSDSNSRRLGLIRRGSPHCP